MTVPSKAVDGLLKRIAGLPSSDGRVMIAVAGPPASGKSTLAETLVASLTASGSEAALVPMDGFHLDDAVLSARGILHRKGAPETFDAYGFVHAMSRLKQGGEVVLPSFDRSLEKSIAGSIVVPPKAKTVVVEGNYLLFNEPPWTELQNLWSLSVFLNVPEDELERRLMRRWRLYKFSEAEAAAKTQANDLPNARRVAATASSADIVLDEIAL